MAVKGGISPLHDIKKNVWRVPIKIVNGEFKVWVDTNYFRIFSKQTLPDAIKSPLVIIQAQGCRLKAYAAMDFEIAGGSTNHERLTISPGSVQEMLTLNLSVESRLMTV